MYIRFFCAACTDSDTIISKESISEGLADAPLTAHDRLRAVTTAHSGKDGEIGEHPEDYILDVPLICEFLIFARRKDRKQYLGGSVLIQPNYSRVIKLCKDVLKESWIYGVYFGEIDNFGGFGVHAFFGVDECLYVHSIHRWGVVEENWEVYNVQGGWKIRDLGSDTELDEDKYHGKI